ncbi:MAG: hypothetical protein LBM01_01755 [Christensenellaceae bacterium]|jgi:hypothetical protein|nr:hypothetical protein [Christensenellaceae bacterium]
MENDGVKVLGKDLKRDLFSRGVNIILLAVIIGVGVWFIGESSIMPIVSAAGYEKVNCEVSVMEKFGAELNIEDIKSDEDWSNILFGVYFTPDCAHNYIAYKFTFTSHEERVAYYTIKMNDSVSPYLSSFSDELIGAISANSTKTVYIIIDKFEQVSEIEEIAKVSFY